MTRAKFTFTESQSAEVARLYADGLTARAIGRMYGATHTMVVKVLRAANIPITTTCRPKVPKLVGNVDELVRRYEAGESTVELARAFGVTQGSLSTVIKKAGVVIREVRESCRTTTIDHTAFDVRSPEMLYWLGILITDGCVQRSKTHDSWRITLTLKLSDRHHVERFRDFVKSDAAIATGGPKNHTMGEHTIQSTGFASVKVTSKPIAMRLSEFGVIPKKSLIAKAGGGVELSRDFWRGCVDGDGFLSWHQNKQDRIPMIGLCGSEDLVRQFECYAKSIAPSIKATSRRGATVWNFRVAGEAAIALIRHLYRDGDVSLPRKYSLAREMIVEYIGRPKNRSGMVPHPLCLVDGCEREAAAKGLCRGHYAAQYSWEKRRAEGKKQRKRRTDVTTHVNATPRHGFD